MGSIRGFAGYGAKNVAQMSCLGSKHPEKLTLFYRDGVLITQENVSSSVPYVVLQVKQSVLSCLGDIAPSKFILKNR